MRTASQKLAPRTLSYTSVKRSLTGGLATFWAASSACTTCRTSNHADGPLSHSELNTHTLKADR